jgi:ankyrin repeat protein
MTPMHAACLIGDYKTCRILLEAGANMQQKDIKGFLPIHYAVINDHDELLTLFNEHHKIDIFD